MNQFFTAIIEGFGRAMGQNLYNFAKRSLGFTSNRESTLDWDTTDHDGEDDDDDHHDGADPGSPI